MRRRATSCAAAAAAVLAAIIASGCGGSSAATSASGSSSTASSSATAPLQTGQVAQAGQFDAPAIYGRVAPGVVTVISVFPGSGGIGGLIPGGGGQQAAQGSGFVISTTGEIVTNAHVVTNGTAANLQRATQVYVKFPDSNQVPAKIVGADPNADVALLRIDPSGLALRPLTLGTSSNLVVGAPVAALGTPFGEQGSLSVGVISATNRAIQSLNGSTSQGTGYFAIPGAIQTDAAINHGNSGGPLVDGAGAVIGINSQIDSSSGSGSGVGFAVPVDAVKRSVGQLRAHGSVAYAYLGVSSQPLFPQFARHLGLKVAHGALLRDVNPGGPAAKAGLKGGSRQIKFDAQTYYVGGDVITKLNGRDIVQSDDLASAVSQLDPGQTVTLEVWSGGTKRDVKVTLGTRPNSGAG